MSLPRHPDPSRSKSVAFQLPPVPATPSSLLSSSSSGAPRISLVSATTFLRSAKRDRSFVYALEIAPKPEESSATPPPDQDPASIVPAEFADFQDVFSKKSASALPP